MVSLPTAMLFLPTATLSLPTVTLSLLPSLPPVLGKLVAKSKAGSFVAMKEFLLDNIALSQHLEELNGPMHHPTWLSRTSNARKREVSSPSQSAICYLTYVAVWFPDPQVHTLLT